MTKFETFKAWLETNINRVKDGYLWCAEKVSEHPHIFIWAALLYVAVRR